MVFPFPCMSSLKPSEKPFPGSSLWPQSFSLGPGKPAPHLPVRLRSQTDQPVPTLLVGLIAGRAALHFLLSLVIEHLLAVRKLVVLNCLGSLWTEVPRVRVGLCGWRLCGLRWGFVDGGPVGRGGEMGFCPEPPPQAVGPASCLGPKPVGKHGVLGLVRTILPCPQ